MELEYFHLNWIEPKAQHCDLVLTERDKIRLQILAAQNTEKMFQYLFYLDRQIGAIHADSPKNFSKIAIQLFSPLFQDGFRYENYEKLEIISRFQSILSRYHILFPEHSWQNYFRGDTPATLMILWDTWYLAYTAAWEWKYRSI